MILAINTVPITGVNALDLVWSVALLISWFIWLTVPSNAKSFDAQG